MAGARGAFRPRARAAIRAAAWVRRAPRCGPGERLAGATRVEDVDGAFRDWLLRRPGDGIIVLRPDRYVAAVCGRDDLDEVTSRLRAILQPATSMTRATA